MSIPYHRELFNNGKIKLMANYSGIKNDIAEENIQLHFYAIDADGVPIFSEKLNINETRTLYSHLDSISVIKNTASKSSKFIETTDEINAVLDRLESNEVSSILSLLEKFESEEKVKGLLDSLSDLEIKDLHGAYHYRLIENEIRNLEKMIKLEHEGDIVSSIKMDEDLLKYSAGQPEKIFQNWIESNLWIFGVEYINKHDARKIALFSEADLLMESVDGYLDLIELKRPKHDILKYDNSHNCHYPHPDLSKVIGQSLYYLQKLEDYKLNIEKEYEVKIIVPRVKIIIGDNKSFGSEENDCIRMLNSKLNSIQVITYNDLISYGKLLLKNAESRGDS